MSAPVAIIMGSQSDWDTMRHTAETLAVLGVGCDKRIVSAHRTPDRLFVIYARCTHLGCTPDWKPAENKFKCPCHGSGYDSEGVNFEGPAPRPMDRAHVELDATGAIVVDTSRLYQQPKGQPTQFNNPEAYLSV